MKSETERMRGNFEIRLNELKKAVNKASLEDLPLTIELSLELVDVINAHIEVSKLFRKIKENRKRISELIDYE